jgi:uncharacterized protein
MKKLIQYPSLFWLDIVVRSTPSHICKRNKYLFVVKMKIWLDTRPMPFIHSDKGGGSDYSDCDCDCGDCGLYGNSLSPYKTVSDDLLSGKDNFNVLQLKQLKQTSPLHIQACNDHTWLACNPVGTGKVAVLDAPTLAFLERFRAPTTLANLREQSQGLSKESIGDAARVFYATGLIDDVEQATPEHREQTPQILQTWLHVTNACNLRCQYCYIQKSSEHMPEDVSRRAVDAIFRSALKQQFKGIRIKYAGGEASLVWPRILEIHRYARQLAEQHALELSAYIITNGVVLPRLAVEQFKEQKIGITISLDGINKFHDTQRPFASGLGSFKYVNRTVTQLLANDFVPHINVTVSQRNLAGLPSLIAYILERGMPFTLSYYRENACSMHLSDLQFADAQMITGMRAAFQVIEEHLPQRRLLDSLIDKANARTQHNHTCTAGRNYLVIDQRGGIAKCHTEIQRTVTSIDADDPLQAIQNDRSDFENLPVGEKEGCRTCTWRHWCTGGCPLVTYRTTGRNDIRSPNCHIYQTLFPDVLRLEALRLLKYESPVIL